MPQAAGSVKSAAMKGDPVAPRIVTQGPDESLDSVSGLSRQFETPLGYEVSTQHHEGLKCPQLPRRQAMGGARISVDTIPASAPSITTGSGFNGPTPMAGIPTMQ